MKDSTCRSTEMPTTWSVAVNGRPSLTLSPDAKCAQNMFKEKGK